MRPKELELDFAVVGLLSGSNERAAGAGGTRGEYASRVYPPTHPSASHLRTGLSQTDIDLRWNHKLFPQIDGGYGTDFLLIVYLFGDLQGKYLHFLKPKLHARDCNDKNFPVTELRVPA